MRSDGGGLGNDAEIVAAEHLVPSTRDRLLRRGHDTEEDVAERITAVHLLRPREEESTGTIVQQSGIGRTQRCCDGGIASCPEEPIV